MIVIDSDIEPLCICVCVLLFCFKALWGTWSRTLSVRNVVMDSVCEEHGHGLCLWGTYSTYGLCKERCCLNNPPPSPNFHLILLTIWNSIILTLKATQLDTSDLLKSDSQFCQSRGSTTRPWRKTNKTGNGETNVNESVNGTRSSPALITLSYSSTSRVLAREGYSNMVAV